MTKVVSVWDRRTVGYRLVLAERRMLEGIATEVFARQRAAERKRKRALLRIAVACIAIAAGVAVMMVRT